MGSTQSISRTIQPITVKLSQNVANISNFILTNNKKDSHVTFGGHFGSQTENMKNAFKQLHVFHTKMDKMSIYIKYQTSGFIRYIVSLEINQSITVEGLNASCMSSPWTSFRYF